jgi:hypothetical protein
MKRRTAVICEARTNVPSQTTIVVVAAQRPGVSSRLSQRRAFSAKMRLSAGQTVLRVDEQVPLAVVASNGEVA